MGNGLNQRRIALALLVWAFWPIPTWCVQRVAPPSEKLCGALALATAVSLLLRDKAWAAGGPAGLGVPAALIASYGIARPFAPELATAILAMLAAAVTLSRLLYGITLHASLCGLVMLALPVISRAQFYLGYPLRLVVGILAVPLIRMSGYPVVREGAVLSTGTELIVIDAPCSGIKMLWAGMFLAFTLCWLRRLSFSRTMLVLLAALVAVLGGNALRASALFVLETSPLDPPAWTHDAVGLVTFGVTVVPILLLVRVMHRSAPCGP